MPVAYVKLIRSILSIINVMRVFEVQPVWATERVKGLPPLSRVLPVQEIEKNTGSGTEVTLGATPLYSLEFE